MYGKIKRSIAKLIVMMGMAAVFIGLLGLQSPAQASDTSSTTTVTATPNVLNANAQFVGKSKKVYACKAYAEKLEQQAPPRDPQALCKGFLRVKIVGVVKTPPCPSGWFGGSAKLRIDFLQKARARAFAKSVASGRVRTWARTRIYDRIKVTGEASSTCVRIPIVTPPPPPPPTCVTHPDMPECYTPPPPPETYAPTMDASAGVCVAPGGTSGVINVTGTNKDNVTRTLIFTAPGKSPVEKTVSAGSTESVSFSGFAPGSYTVRVEVKETGKFATKAVTVIQCDTPPPPPPVDHKPVVNIMGSPAHLYVGGNAHIWIEASDPDGDAVSVKVAASGAGTVAGLVPSDVRWDGTPCPTGKTCFRATAWAGSTPGNMTITATVTANGLSGEPDSVTFPVKADEF